MRSLSTLSTGSPSAHRRTLSSRETFPFCSYGDSSWPPETESSPLSKFLRLV
jgi:hypothetical protein